MDEDIDAARAALDRLAQGARTLVFFGTGGSSLGGQTWRELGAPSNERRRSEQRPRTRFYDNVDTRPRLANLDLKPTRFVSHLEIWEHARDADAAERGNGRPSQGKARLPSRTSFSV